MKSILEVWKDYLRSVNTTEFSELGITDSRNRFELFSDVTGFHETKDDCGRWLEFDCYTHHEGKRRHVKMHGWVTKEITLMDE